MKINESGRSMIEMLGVLAIIGVLSVGGIAGYSKAMSKYRTNKMIDQATMLITNIRTMFAQQQSYDGLNNSRAVNLALVPEEMIVAPGTPMNDDETRRLRNVFSGEVLIGSSPIDSEDDAAEAAFKVSFFGISRDACIQVATSDWGAGSSSGLIGMHIWGADANNYKEDGVIDSTYKNGTEGSQYIAVPGDPVYKVPFTVVQAQKACDCGNKTTCAVTWKYF
jgi:type II secretory pathway pseudopilin PulG